MREPEIFKPIPDYEKLYCISNYGNVKSLRTGKFLTLQLSKKGYYRVTLSKNNKSKTFTTHRIVAEIFVPNPDEKPQVNHVNEIKTDNFYKNLQWVTNLENNHFGTARERQIEKMINGKLSIPVNQYSLDGKLIKEFSSIAEAARSGFISTHISKCLTGKFKQHRGFVWKEKIII